MFLLMHVLTYNILDEGNVRTKACHLNLNVKSKVFSRQSYFKEI